VSELPAGWRIASLAEATSIVMGQSPPSEDYNTIGSGRPFLQGKAEFTHFNPKPSKYCTRPLKVGVAGSVLMSVRAPVGDVNLADQDYIIGRGLAALRPKDGDALFLFYALLKNKGRIAALGSGTTFQSINRAVLDGFEVAFPPVPEQFAIAAALRAVQDARDARRRELILERERKAALMEDLFTKGTRGEELAETEIGALPQRWVVCRLGDVAEVSYGLTVNQTRRSSDQTAPYLTVANVMRGRLRLDGLKYIGTLEGDTERFRLKLGDVLLVEGNGNPQLLGSAATWNDELPFALHQNHLIRARPNQAVVLPLWLMSYVNSSAGRAQLFGRAKTSSGLHSINSRLVSNLRVPCPPLDEQRDIVEVLTICDAKIAALEREAAVQDELFRALLEELMTGRLSALPPTDEAGVRPEVNP